MRFTCQAVKFALSCEVQWANCTKSCVEPFVCSVVGGLAAIWRGASWEFCLWAHDCLAVRRGAVEKKTVLENLDLILLAMDETVDGGCVSFKALATWLVSCSWRLWMVDGHDVEILTSQCRQAWWVSARETRLSAFE